MSRNILSIIFICIIVSVAFACAENKESKQEEQSAESEEAEEEEEEKIEAVRVQTLVPEKITPTVEVSGTLISDRDVTIVSETSGRILSYALELGKAVRKGDILLAVDSEPYRIQVDSAKAGLEQATAAFAMARKTFDRSKTLHESGDLADAQFDDARMMLDQSQAAVEGAKAALAQAKRSLKLSSIRAPFGGEITSKLVKLGDTLAPGTPVCGLADPKAIKVSVGVGEDAIGGILPGLEASVLIPTITEAPLPAKIASIGIKALKPSMTYPVELKLDSPPPQLRIGMVARVLVPTEKGREALVVPIEIITDKYDKSFVFVVEDDHVSEREVSPGVKVGNRMVLAKGVQAGEVIVVSGQSKLKNGSKIKIVE